MDAPLYLIATPIGNLEDITIRALRVLREEVAIIACEDTRQSHKLLEHYQIRKLLVSYHEHNEAARTVELLEHLQAGESVALLSDAGTPLISDPGFRLVTAAIEAGISVVSVPGPSAALTALVASGLPTEAFRFIGFLPPKTAARRALFESLQTESATVIAYESPHRILYALDEAADILGDRPMVVARELTKIHEEYLRGNARQIHERLAGRPAVKGEFTILIGRGSRIIDTASDPLAEIERRQIEEGTSRMDAIKQVAKQFGLPKREVYRLAEQKGNSSPDKRRDADQTHRKPGEAS